MKQTLDVAEFGLSELLLGFSSAALHYMGAGQDGQPRKDAKETNLGLARQNIDIIRLLQEKTRGNVTAEEEKLFETVLTDLMLKYHQLKQS